jgi:hypothetical protein
MVERFNIGSLLRERSGQQSFHTVSERHVRIEFRNMKGGDAVGPFSYDGDIVLTCYAGVFQVETDGAAIGLGDLDQVVVSQGTTLRMSCQQPGMLQLIWSPAHARTTQPRE